MSWILRSQALAVCSCDQMVEGCHTPGFVGEGHVDGHYVALAQEAVQIVLKASAQLINMALAVAAVVQEVHIPGLCSGAHVFHSMNILCVAARKNCPEHIILT